MRRALLAAWLPILARAQPDETSPPSPSTCSYPNSFRQTPIRPFFYEWRASHEGAVMPPLEYISDEAFAWLLTYCTWVSVLIIGLGSELIVGHILVEVLSVKRLKQFWQGAQLAFPLFLNIAIASRSYWGLLFLVLGLWKCGSPETIAFYKLARKRNDPWLARLEHACNFIGTLIHHSATSLLVVSLVTGRELLDRNMLTCTLPLVVQHWTVLLKYVDALLCTTAVLVVEVVWEWEVLWNLQLHDCIGWHLALIAWAMLAAHWLYLTAAIIKLLRARPTIPSPAAGPQPLPASLERGDSDQSLQSAASDGSAGIPARWSTRFAEGVEHRFSEARLRLSTLTESPVNGMLQKRQNAAWGIAGETSVLAPLSGAPRGGREPRVRFRVPRSPPKGTRRKPCGHHEDMPRETDSPGTPSSAGRADSDIDGWRRVVLGSEELARRKPGPVPQGRQPID